MKLLRRIGLVLEIAVLLAAAGAPALGWWEFLTNVPGSRYTYDLTTTPRAVYMTLGDTLGTCMGLYRYDRLTGETEFVGKPAEEVYGVHVAGGNDEHIWLGSVTNPAPENEYLWHSSDGGDTWEVQRSSEEGLGWYYAVDGSDSGDRLYIAPNITLCMESSSNYGESWISWGGCTNHLYGTRAMECDFFDEERAYAIVVDWSLGKLFVVETTDGGQTWADVYEDYNIPEFGGVYPSPFCESDVTVADGYGVVRARINGQWTYQGYADLWPNLGVVQPRWDGGTWWTAGGNEYGQPRVKRKVGDVWTYWDIGLPQLPRESTHHLGRLWACPVNGQLFLTLPEHGLWTFPVPASAAPDVRLADTGASIRAYPSPAAGPVTVVLDRLAPADYRLGVFDVKGRQVATLHEGPLEGTALRTWSGRDRAGTAASSGVYFLRLERMAGGEEATAKVLRLGR
ncbi:MAG: hypothetical protein GF355_10910 [Candidatus Eisenbacteria bacterium]|nr:hypothetical protein [Candidatus Eisenbacteria bacterium]